MATNSPATKRRRLEIPNRVKREICQMKVDKPAMTINDIRTRVLTDTQLDIGKSTIGDILKAKDKWLNMPADSDNLTRTRQALHQKLEDALVLWINDVTAKNAAINDDMLLAKSRELGSRLDVTDFAYSKGWLARFKTRHGLQKKTLHGESRSANMTEVHAGRQQLRQELQDYSVDDIYNMDETSLFYKLGPNYTLASKPVSGTKKSKERITIALTTNASGTHKLKPFLITKVQRPRCFGKKYDPNVHVRYRFNTKAWMTALLFESWVRDFDREMRRQRRKVILLLDNAACHSRVELTNVTLRFLPPNTTAHIQPMDAGIIRAFKAYYRRQLVRHYLNCVEKEMQQTVDLRQAIRMIRTAWETVTAGTIAACYRHTAIIPQLQKRRREDDSDDDVPLQRLARRSDSDDEDNAPLSHLKALMRQVPSASMTANEFVNIDANEPTGEELDDEDIVNIVSRGDSTEPTTDDEDDTSEQTQEVTTTQASQHIEGAIGYFEQTTGSTDVEENQEILSNLLRIQRVLEKRAARTGTQTTITNFFKT